MVTLACWPMRSWLCYPIEADFRNLPGRPSLNEAPGKVLASTGASKILTTSLIKCQLVYKHTGWAPYSQNASGCGKRGFFFFWQVIYITSENKINCIKAVQIWVNEQNRKVRKVGPYHSSNASSFIKILD